jgi:preprotein translocase subunit SecG
MQIWTNIVLVLQIVSAMVMIGLVLVQHGKGADMGASFGSGASGSLFGATGSANFLSRSTAVCASIFFVATLALAFMSAGGATRAPTGGTVLDRPAAATGAASSAIPASSVVIPGAVIPGAAIPGAATASAPAPAASR